MKAALAVRHVHCEHLGTLEGALHELGYIVRYIDAPTADFQAEPLPDLLVVLGGPISVNDTADYPFLEQELAFVRRSLNASRHVLGICLGAQLMAKALGARVTAMPHKELGWASLQATPAGERHPLRWLLQGSPEVLHWHGETFELPPGATRLCGTPECANQAFSVGRGALGLQFHPEVSFEQLETWFVAHTLELSSIGRDVSALRRESKAKAPLLHGLIRRFLNDWLTWVEQAYVPVADAGPSPEAP
jgi:GMP synthase (glutamine-hydrolysing)